LCRVWTSDTWRCSEGQWNGMHDPCHCSLVLCCVCSSQSWQCVECM